MRTDFTPDNVDLWIDNWKRKEVVGSVITKSWLETYPFETANIIVNHSSVTMEDFPEEIRHRVTLWPNVMRHDTARGPINRNINQAYVHTFLSGKKYCVVAHDSYYAKPGWEIPILTSDYDLYIAPQGEGWHLQTLDGLKTFGWWDERYATMGWHEIDYIARAFRKSFILKEGKASIVDKHGLWPVQFPFVNNRTRAMYYNTVGLEDYVLRLPKETHPQIGTRATEEFTKRAEEWHFRKWTHPFDHHNLEQLERNVMYNLTNGPRESEIDWYPWLDLDCLKSDRSAY